MMKKYFAMTVIAASVALVGCSDDDDDPVDTPNMPGPVDPDVNNPAVDATPGVGGTAYDTIVNNPDTHSTLRSLLDAAGLDVVLDDPANEYTIFAPTNAAIEAAQNALGEAFPSGDALTRVLTYHVLPGTVTSSAALEAVTNSGDAGVANVDTILVDLPGTDAAVTQSVALTSGGSLGLLVNDTDVIIADLVTEPAVETTEEVVDEAVEEVVDEVVETVPVGLVHVVDGVLLPPDAPEAPVEENPDNENPDTENPDNGNPTDIPSTGPGSDALADNFTIFRAGIANDFAGALDNQAWTFFVPSDATLDGVTSLTAAQLQAHIHTDGAVDPTSLAGLTTIKSSLNVDYPVATEAGDITVDGNVVEFLGTGAAGAQIYSISGVLGQ